MGVDVGGIGDGVYVGSGVEDGITVGEGSLSAGEQADRAITIIKQRSTVNFLMCYPPCDSEGLRTGG